MKINKKYVIVIILWTILSVHEALSHTLEDIIISAINKSEKIDIAKNKLKEKKTLFLKKDYIYLLPNAEIIIDYSSEKIKNTIKISKNLINLKNIKMLEVHNVELFNNEYRLELQNFLLDIIESYTNLILCKKIYSYKKENLRIWEKYKMNFTKNTALNKHNELNIEIIFSEIVTKTLEAKHKLEAAKINFIFLTKMDPDNIFEEVVINTDPELILSNQIVELIEKNNVQLKSENIKLKILDLLIGNESIYPNISINSEFSQEIKNKSKKNKHNISLTLNIDIPFYNNNSLNSKITELKINKANQKHIFNIMKNKLLENARQLQKHILLIKESIKVNDTTINKINANLIEPANIQDLNSKDFMNIMKIKNDVTELIIQKELKSKELKMSQYKLISIIASIDDVVKKMHKI